MRTLVRLLIEQIAPVAERIVGGWRTVVGIRPAFRERWDWYDHGGEDSIKEGKKSVGGDQRWSYKFGSRCGRGRCRIRGENISGDFVESLRLGVHAEQPSNGLMDAGVKGDEELEPGLG